jgi:hypothetical protein
MLHNPELGDLGLSGGCKLELEGSGVFYLEPISITVYLLREGEIAVSVAQTGGQTNGS